MLERQIDDLMPRKNSGEIRTNVVEIRIPVVIHPEETALEKVLSQPGSFLIREFVVCRVLHAQDGTTKEIRVHCRKLRKSRVAVIPMARLDRRELREALQEVVITVGIVVAPA